MYPYISLKSDGKETQKRCVCVASHTDVLRGPSHIPAPLMSADLSGKKCRPITADFQIWELHFGPLEIFVLDLATEKIRKVS